MKMCSVRSNWSKIYDGSNNWNEISDKKRAAIQMKIEICEVASTMKSAMEVVMKMESAMDDGKMHVEVASEM